jgi:hypothetical protein
LFLVDSSLGSLRHEDAGSVSDVSEIPAHEYGGSYATKTWAALPTSTQCKDPIDGSALTVNNRECLKSVTIHGLVLIESIFTLQTFYVETDLQ